MSAPIPVHLSAQLEPQAVPAAKRPCEKRWWRVSAFAASLLRSAALAVRAVREQHGRDESPFDVPPPEFIVFCESTEEVSDVLRLGRLRAAAPAPAYASRAITAW